MFSHSSLLGSLDVIKCRASVQALSLKKLPFQLLQELCPLLFSLSLSLSLSLSKSQKTSWRVSLEVVWDTSSPSFSAFGARFPTIPPGDLTKVQGHTWDKMTQSPLLQNRSDLPSYFDPSKVSPLQLRCSDDDSFSPSRVSSSAFSPPPASRSRRLLLASCPALLPFFALTLVIGWFLTVSLLLLSHSGASVVAVENGYPCLFFFVITQIKIPMN